MSRYGDVTVIDGVAETMEESSLTAKLKADMLKQFELWFACIIVDQPDGEACESSKLTFELWREARVGDEGNPVWGWTVGTTVTKSQY